MTLCDIGENEVFLSIKVSCQTVLVPLLPSNNALARVKDCEKAVDAEQVQQQWLSQFEELQDPRGLQGQTHAFLSIVLIAILATIGGATGWEDMELYGESHQAWERNLSGFKAWHSPC